MVAAALQKHVRRVARPAASSSRAAAATDFQRIQESEARTVAAVAVATIGSIPFEFFMVGRLHTSLRSLRDVQSCLFLRVRRRHFKEQLTNCLPISASATSVQERGVHRRGPPLWTRHGGLCQRRDVLHRPGKRSSNMNRTIMIIQMNNVSIMNR